MSFQAPHVSKQDVPLDVFRISAMLVHFASRFDAQRQAEFFEALSSSVSMLRDVSKDTALDPERAESQPRPHDDSCLCNR